MKYRYVKDDVLAINALLEAGRIELEEANEMRRYLEELTVV